MSQILVHGGDTAGYLEEFGRLPLDFSANVSPLGLPAGVRQAAAAALQTADGYPDPLCRPLCRALAGRYALAPEQIVCGAGAADIIWRLALALGPGKALVAAPTFAEYEAALSACGWQVGQVALSAENGWAYGESLCRAVVPGVKLVFLCQPNNPTGSLCPRPLALRLLAACQRVGALLVADECFVEFLDDPAAVTLAGEAAHSKNLLVLSAFTKLYAMAGLRLGYALCGDGAMAARLRAAGQPWAVSNVAQAAGLAALEETDYVARLRQLIGTQRPRLQAGFARLGIRAQGTANFLFFDAGRPGFAAAMRVAGVPVRDCANYPGLWPGCCRVAVRTGPENDRLLETAARVLEAEN